MGAPDDDFDAVWAEKKKTLRFSRGRNLRPDQILAYYGVELSKNDINDFESSKFMNSTILNASTNGAGTGSQKSKNSNSMMFSLLEAFKNDTVATIKTDVSKRSSGSQSIEEAEKSKTLSSTNLDTSKENCLSQPSRTAGSNSMAFSLLEAFNNDTVASIKTVSSKTTSASQSTEGAERCESFNSSNLEFSKNRSVFGTQKTSNSMTFSLLDAFKNDTVASVKTVSSKRTSVSRSMFEDTEKSRSFNSTLADDRDKLASLNSESLEAFKDLSVTDSQKSKNLDSMTFSLLDAFKNDTIATPKSISSKRSSGISQAVLEESQKIASKSLNFTSLDAFRDESMRTVLSESSVENLETSKNTPKSVSRFSEVNSFRDETMPTALGVSVMSEAAGNKTTNIGTQTSAQSTPAILKQKTPQKSQILGSSKIFEDYTESEPMEVDPTPESLFPSRKSAVSVPSSSSVLSNPIPLKDSTHRSLDVSDERNPTVLPSGSSESVVAAGPGFKIPPLPINKLRLSVLSNRPHFMEPTKCSLARTNSPAFCPKTPPTSRSQSDEVSKTPQFPRRSVAVPRIISEFHPNLDFNSPRFTAFRRSTALKSIANYETPPKSNKRSHAITPSSVTKENTKSTDFEDQSTQEKQNAKSQGLMKSNALSNLMHNYGTPSPARVPKKISRGPTNCAREVAQELTLLSEVDRHQRKEQIPSPVGTTKAFNEDSAVLSSLESSSREDVSEAEKHAKIGISKLTINNRPQNEAISNFNLNYYSDEEEEMPKKSGLNDSVYSVHTHTPARSGRCMALTIKKTGSPIIPGSGDEFEEDEKENTNCGHEMTNVFDPPADDESLPNPMIVKPQQKYVLNKRHLIKPEPETVNDQGLRRSSRTRLKPCRSWLNEQPLYEYGSNMTRTLVGVTEVEIKNKQYQKYLTASPVTLNDRRVAEQKRRKKQKETRKRYWQEQRLEDSSLMNQSGDM
ncbi:hypothetical protein FO519_006880 [Halicephalobus sp. NKZ332]|nr:hypothetical protein FO519_006880 [Halicephalobus sp. NKZ332]